MSRNLVYVNGQNESITFETGPYLIVKIEGLGIPNVDRQEQKAPYQDGTTYIDSLLQNRDIVVELAITKPNDFPNIALYRRELSQRLCPKYGLGTLTYTDEDNNAYNIRAVVSSMVFPNKDYRDPYMRAMVTFTACDPYWKDVTTDSISLPTVTNSAENSINPNPSHGQSIIQKTNGNLFVVYIRGSDSYLVSREYTTSWSAESVISTNTVILPGSIPSMVEKSDGSIVLVYIRVTDLYLVSKTYTTSWSAESTINASASALPSIIQKTNGNLFVVYIRGSDSYLVSREYTTSWSAESTINAGNTQRAQVIQKTNGNLFVVYVKSTGYLVSREYTTSWSAESTINAATSKSPSVIEQNDGSLYLVYIGSGSSLVSRLYTTSWSPESVLLLNLIETPIVIRYNITSLIISYIKTANGYLVSVTRSVSPVPAVITGDVPAPILVTFNGPSVNPRIINQNTLEYIRLNTTLAAGDHFDVDTSFGNKTVKLTQGGIVKNGIAFLDIGSTFFQLARPTLPNLPVGVNPYRGLKAYYAMENIPEIPDDSAGVTYLQDAWATVDGWNGAGGGATSFGSGNLVFTHTGANQYVTKTISFASGTWKLRVRLASGTLDSALVWLQSNFSGPVSKPITTNGTWTIIDANFTSAVTSLQLFAGSALIYSGSYVLEIDWVYIGTGAYLPNSLLDNSGNGNHGTIYGATPVAGISGKALAGNGTSAYVSMGDVAKITGALSLSVWVKANVSITTGILGILGKYRTGGDQRQYIIDLTNGVPRFVISGDGTSVIVVNAPNTVLSTSYFEHISAVFIPGTGIYLYRNGLLVASNTTSIPASLFNGTASLELLRDITGTLYTPGTIDEPRIYNRALSAEEVRYLYDNPGVPIPADATVVYYEDDAVLSTATATMEWTERYVGL